MRWQYSNMNTIILLDRNSIKEEENSETEVKRKLSSKEWKLVDRYVTTVNNRWLCCGNYLYTCYWANIHSPKRNREYVYTDFHQNIIDVWKTTWYFIFEKNISRQTCWKAGTQSQKGLKSESLTRSAGYRCFHIIYRKDVKTEEISITFILYRWVILKKCSRDTGIFGQVSFLYAKMGKKTGRDRFSVYR